jgi:hypothetical protein
MCATSTVTIALVGEALVRGSKGLATAWSSKDSLGFERRADESDGAVADGSIGVGAVLPHERIHAIGGAGMRPPLESPGLSLLWRRLQRGSS